MVCEFAGAASAYPTFEDEFATDRNAAWRLILNGGIGHLNHGLLRIVSVWSQITLVTEIIDEQRRHGALSDLCELTMVEVIEPKLDDDGRIAADYPCAACGYNLRSLLTSAACPECGQDVAQTVATRRSRLKNLWGLENFAIGSRVMYALFGVVLPLVCFFMAPLESPLAPDWQSGQIDDYIGLLYGGPPLIVFFPLLLYAMVALALMLICPLWARQRMAVRIGVFSGVILALQYGVILCVALEPGWLIAVIVWVLAAGVFVGVTYAYRYLTSYWKLRNFPRYCRVRNYTLLAVGMLAPLLVGLSILINGSNTIEILIGAPALFALVFAPGLTLLVFVLMSIRIVMTGIDQRDSAAIALLPGVAWGAAWLGSWALAIHQAVDLYQALPTNPPSGDCYITTAAAHGHRRLVGGRVVRLDDRSSLRINRQMRICKISELALRALCPRGHRICRAVYDAIGPALAHRINRPLRADLAFLLVCPFTLCAALGLRLVVGDMQPLIDRVYPSGGDLSHTDNG